MQAAHWRFFVPPQAPVLYCLAEHTVEQTEQTESATAVQGAEIHMSGHAPHGWHPSSGMASVR